MGSAFYAEHQIWPWFSDLDVVMFTLNGGDVVCHPVKRECDKGFPHELSQCGYFQGEVAMADEKKDERNERSGAPGAQKVGADKKQQKVERTHVMLKNGNGTVAIEDYDPKIHGKALEETDEQYLARINSRPQAILGARLEPPTTIPHLQTGLPVVVPTPVPPPPPPVQAFGQPVLTSADVEKDEVLKDEAAEGRVRLVEASRDRITTGHLHGPAARTIPGVNAPANSVSEMGGSTKPPEPSRTGDNKPAPDEPRSKTTDNTPQEPNSPRA